MSFLSIYLYLSVFKKIIFTTQKNTAFFFYFFSYNYKK